MDTVTLTPAADLTYDDVVVLVDWMAEHHFTVDEITYAVAKPWKHRDWIRRAHLGAPPADETSETTPIPPVHPTACCVTSTR